MDNFEVNERAQILSDTMTPYALARRIIELEDDRNKTKADAVREEIEYIKSNRPHWYLSVEYEMMMNRLNKLERGEL